MVLKHLLGVLGVAAACVLLAVSAAINWSFGCGLGKTAFDCQIYGAASAAADCFKALVPFFFFAAVRNRMWAQALASALVWTVVTSYSMTSAIGHVSVNRLETVGVRTVETQTYNDLRADLKRAQDQLSWVPQHRPSRTVLADVDNLKSQRAWTWTKGCTELTGKQGREFCQQYHTLSAELASAEQATQFETRIADIHAKLDQRHGQTHIEADPQAATLARMVTALGLPVKTADMQTAMSVFVAILLEIGSGFGMFVAFSQWRLYDQAPMPRRVPTSTSRASTVPASEVEAPLAIAPLKSSANDNRSTPAQSNQQRLIAPESDVQRFHKERIEIAEGSSLTATALYEDYCAWCEEQEKEPLALPTFGREFGELGVQKAKIAGRVRYIGVRLNSGIEHEEDKKSTASSSKAA